MGSSRLPPHPLAVQEIGGDAGHHVGEERAVDLGPEPEHPIDNGQDDQRGERRDGRHQRVPDELEPLRGLTEAPETDQGVLHPKNVHRSVESWLNELSGHPPP